MGIYLTSTSGIRNESEPDVGAEQPGFSLSNVQSRYAYVKFRPPYIPCCLMSSATLQPLLRFVYTIYRLQVLKFLLILGTTKKCCVLAQILQ